MYVHQLRTSETELVHKRMNSDLNFDLVQSARFNKSGRYYPGQKKRTILEIRGEKNAVPRVISCSIRRDQRRAKVADSRGSDLPCADRA